MRRTWWSRAFGIVGIGALVIGAGVVVAPAASAAPVADAAALRAAIDSLNGTGQATEIELVPGTVYSLPGGSCKDENNNAAGDLDIRRSQALKIFTPDGSAPAILENTCDNQRIIDHAGAPDAGTGKLTLRNVVLRNGHAPNGDDGRNLAGAVLSAGDVAIENAKLENNSAGNGSDGNDDRPEGGVGGFGGAVLALGNVTIEGSTFSGNKAGNGGKGRANAGKGCDGGLGGQGGAVLAVGGLTITNSTFTGNSAGSGGDGGDGRCVEGSSGAGGHGGTGGAVQCGVVVPGGRGNVQPFGCLKAMVVRGSTLSGNTTGNGGNGGAGRTGGAGGDGGTGGAILFVGAPKTANGPATLLVENSTVDGNSSGDGGAGGNGGDAGNGGNGGKAGAIAAGFASRPETPSRVAALVHVTVTENGAGGTLGSAGKPDVLVPAAAPAAVAGKPGTAGQPGGGSVAMFDPWASVSTVIGTTDNASDGPDCWQQATSIRFSLSTDADTDTTGCGFGPGTVQPFATFALGALANNGGPTQTRLPGAASTLVDKVAGVRDQLAVDQRAVPRPQASKSDIGAVELQIIDMTLTKTASAASVAIGTAVTFTITAKGTGKVSPQPGVTLEDPNCEDMSAASGDANTNNTLDPGETFTYTCTATPTEPGTFTNTATATITDAAGVKITRTASVDVTVTGSSSAAPPLAKTGTNNPLPELATGLVLLIGGAALVLATRQRRIRIRTNGR